MTYLRYHRRGPEKDRRGPSCGPAKLGEDRRRSAGGGAARPSAGPLCGGHLPGGL